MQAIYIQESLCSLSWL